MKLTAGTEKALQDPSRTDVDLENLGLSNEDLPEAIHLIPDIQKITELSLEENNLNDDCVTHIAQFPALKRLWIGKNSLTIKGLKQLIETCPHLEFINIEHNYLPNYITKELSKEDEAWLLDQAPKITFSLRYTGLSKDLQEQIADRRKSTTAQTSELASFPHFMAPRKGSDPKSDGSTETTIPPSSDEDLPGNK